MGGTSAEDLKHVRITRVDESMPMGGWLRAHGLPCQGLYVDSGIEAGRPRSEGDGKRSNDAIVPASVAKSPTTRALLLRDGSQEPIDDLEYDYLVHLAHDFELIYEGESQKREERHIAQTLQIGMRNSWGCSGYRNRFGVPVGHELGVGRRRFLYAHPSSRRLRRHDSG